MSRRGQIALFVIVGLVLLLIVLLLLFRNSLFGVNIQNTLEAQRTSQVQSFVAGCADASLEKLIRQAGANGGYLDTSKLHHGPFTWESDVVDFPPQEVPYWSHLKQCSESAAGCEATEQPPLCKQGAPCPVKIVLPNQAPSVQEQLEQALPGEVATCLDGFKALADQYDIAQQGTVSATVLFVNGGVEATLIMPITITDKSSGKTALLREFPAKANVDLVRIYSMSHDIAQAERETSFLERLTLHLLAIYSGVDAPLPPMRDLSILGQKRYWSRTQVEQLLQDEVLPWADFIQVPNALGSFIPIWPSQNESAGLTAEEQQMYAGVFYYLYAKVNNETYPDMKVKFFYPETKPYLSINGGQELLKPRSVDVGGLLQKMLGLFINDYRFRYDLTYPVIVTVTDPGAFGGKGLDWSFSLEADIRRNEPVNRTATATSFLLANAQVDLTSPQQLVRNTILLTTTDKHTGALLPGVRISYQCGDEFFIGQTNESGALVTRFPYCRYGGVILYSKYGYLGSGVEYDNYEDGVTKEFSLALWPLQNVTLQVRKRTPADIAALTATAPTEETIRNNSHSLNDTDLVILNLARVKESPYDEDVPMISFYTFTTTNQTFTEDVEAKKAEIEALKAQGVLTDQDVQDYLDALNASVGQLLSPTQQSVTVALAPGTYTIDAYLLHNGQFTIPQETREFCMVGGGSLCIGKKSFTLNATNFTTWLSGGASLNESAPFELNENTLYRFNTYTLYTLEQPLPQTWHDLENYQTPDEFLQGKRLLELPTYG
jgi:hypothetical protein